MLESFVCNWLWDHLVPSLDPYQYGCMKNSSTTHALIKLTHNWLKGIDVPGNIVQTCMIDFAKAFDCIDHNIILQKLQALEVHPLLINWIADFLRNRQQRVKLADCFSNWLPKPAGVPQGTKRGPILFIVMINYLAAIPTSNTDPIIKYVDDCTAFEILNRNSSSNFQSQKWP